MKAKRITALLMTLTLAFSLAACGGKAEDEASRSNAVSDNFDALTGFPDSADEATSTPRVRQPRL